MGEPRHPRVNGVRALVAGALLLLATVTAGGVAAAAPGGLPGGALDVVREAPGGTVEVAGWAKDPDTDQSIAVHVYVDGQGVATPADRFRPDLVPLFGSGRHGFEVRIAVAAGRHQVCAYGIDASGTGGGNTTLGCRSIEVSGSPFGSLDLVRTTDSFDHVMDVHVAGWAIDPDLAGPIQVDLYVNGSYRASSPEPGSPANRPRSDVGWAYPYGDAHGFDTWVRLPPYGPATICAYALNKPGTRGVDALLGCRSFSSNYGTPFGSLEPPRLSAIGAHVSGWVIDPDHMLKSLGCPGTTCWMTDSVVVTIDGGVRVPGTVVDATVPRPDVDALFPNYATWWANLVRRQHGYDIDLALTSGAHEICVVALDGAHGANPAGHGDDRALGCVTVVKP